MNIRQWDEHEKARQNRISDNRSLRCRGLPLLPTIPKVEKPKRVQLFSTDNDYIGTWDYGVDESTARNEAQEHGEIVGHAKLV